jgi:hypothetical protein
MHKRKARRIIIIILTENSLKITFSQDCTMRMIFPIGYNYNNRIRRSKHSWLRAKATRQKKTPKMERSTSTDLWLGLTALINLSKSKSRKALGRRLQSVADSYR